MIKIMVVEHADDALKSERLKVTRAEGREEITLYDYDYTRLRAPQQC